MNKSIQKINYTNVEYATRYFCEEIIWKFTKESTWEKNRNVFDVEMGNELVGLQHDKDMANTLFRFTPKRLRKLAYQLAKANNIHQRFNSEKEETGMEWYLCAWAFLNYLGVTPIPYY